VSSLAAYVVIDEFYRKPKVRVLASAILYIVGYTIFVALFGIVMNQINYRNSSFDKIDRCGNIKKKFRRSSNEFIYYSICGFVFIWISIMCTVGSVYAL